MAAVGHAITAAAEKAPAFIAAELAGGVAAIALARYVHPDLPRGELVVPHDQPEAA